MVVIEVMTKLMLTLLAALMSRKLMPVVRCNPNLNTKRPFKFENFLLICNNKDRLNAAAYLYLRSTIWGHLSVFRIPRQG